MLLSARLRFSGALSYVKHINPNIYIYIVLYMYASILLSGCAVEKKEYK